MPFGDFGFSGDGCISCIKETGFKLSLIWIHKKVHPTAHETHLQPCGSEGNKVVSKVVVDRREGFSVAFFDLCQPLLPRLTAVEDVRFCFLKFQFPVGSKPAFTAFRDQNEMLSGGQFCGFGLMNFGQTSRLFQQPWMPSDGECVQQTGRFGFVQIGGQIFDGIAGD